MTFLYFSKWRRLVKSGFKVEAVKALKARGFTLRQAYDRVTEYMKADI